MPFPESSLNQEAGKVFMDNYNEYFRIASLYTRIHSQKHKIENTQNTNNLHNDFFNPQKVNSQNIENDVIRIIFFFKRHRIFYCI